VLVTHPLDRDTGCVLSRTVDLPRGTKASLRWVVGHDPQGDFELIVRANDQPLLRKPVSRETVTDGHWLKETLDLSAFAGHRVKLELVNQPSGWAYEAAYWAEITVEIAGGQNPFFAMDTALRDGKTTSPAAQAALLQELGYDGFGASGYPTAASLAAFENLGLRVVNTYLTLDVDAGKPTLDPQFKEAVARLQGHHTDLWIALNTVTQEGRKLPPSDPAGDTVILPPMRALADLARASDLRVAFYPHTGFWLERFADALRVARAVDRPNVGATFNLCHWLKVEGDRDPQPLLKEGLPRLFFVTINGADSGNTQSMNWDRLIQPLDTGTYDVAGMIRSLRDLGYQGPVGFQGYGIPGASREILSRTMNAWRQMTVP
jgi:sugar phosphate isomerase/epimerase